jgi:sigma-B regulation protein RsbU (phosphoserine phosphatase)
MFLARFDPQEGAVKWSAAGHAALVVRRGGETEELKATTIPVGVDRPRFRPVSCTSLLHPGDVMLVSTDGVAETKNQANEEFGLSRIASVIRDSLDQSTDDLIRSLQTAVGEHRGSSQLADDETIVLIRRQ